MPVINLKISGQEDAALAQQLVTEIGRLTKDVLHKKPEVTVVLVSFVPDHLWFVDALSLADQKAKSFHLVIRISDSTNLKVDKSNYIQAVHESLSALLGGVHPISYTAMQEMKADAYGYDGATIEYKLITNQQKLKSA